MDDHTTEPSLREVMAAYPTGVTIVAARDDEGLPYGLTVNSFTSVSLDPPLVSVCLGHASNWHDGLVAAEAFAVSVLAADQGEVAWRFAKEPSEGRFEGIDWRPGPAGAPIIVGGVAWLECRVERVMTAGDHSIVLGRVTASGTSDRPSLVFHRGRLTSAGT